MVEFGKLNRAIQLPSNPKILLEGLPFKIGEEWSGKRIRNKDMFVEFGGFKARAAAELVEIVDDDKTIEDGKLEIWGPDFDEIDEGATYSFVEIISLAGSKLNGINPGFLERNIVIYHDFIEGVMHLNARNLIWIRIHKDKARKGIKLEHIARAIMGQLKLGIPQIEKIEIRFFIDSANKPNQTLRILNDECYYVWSQRNLSTTELDDDKVDQFYGCKACRHYYPNHACILTPSNHGTCGAVNWRDAKTSMDLDPLGDFFLIPKGEKLDDLYGSYSGINSKIREITNNVVEQVNLYSAIKNPQTSCGMFEALIFYLPEVDGLGIAGYYYKGETPLDLDFSTITNTYNRSLQTPGHRGVALAAMMDKKFMQGDGGWKRIAWMNQELKDKVISWIPKEFIDKIATEKEVKSAKDMKNWILSKNHPLKEGKWDGRTWK